MQISEERSIRDMHTHLEPGASGAARFGGGLPTPSGKRVEKSNAPAPRYRVPEGWIELEPTSMRLINLQPAGNPDAECALSVLAGDGGGLLANVNRWRRDQFGLAETTQAEVGRLPKGLLLGGEATIVSLRGDYTGMGDSPKPDWGLTGYILTTDRITVFVKMTGPADVVVAERENFELFCASMSAGPEATDPHAPSPAPQQPQIDTSRPRDQFGHDMPAGWSVGPPKSMRSLNLIAGESTECYVSVLAGDAGGLVLNINRWRGEMELDPVSAAQIDALPEVKVFGMSVPLLEISGDYLGMGGPGGKAMRMLAVALNRAQGSVFIKMVGPDAEVAAQRESFIAFVESLTER